MALSIPAPKKLRGLRVLIIAATCFVAAGVLAMMFTIWKLRSDAIDDAYKNTGNLATVLSEQTSEAIRATETILFDVQRELTLRGIFTSEDLNNFANNSSGTAILKRRLENHPRADVVTIVGADGHLLATSRAWPTSNLDLSDRDYFKRFLGKNDSLTFISVPVTNRVTGKPMVFFARRLIGESNSFLGVVAVGVQIKSFKAIYEGIGLLGDQSFLFSREDGTVLVRYPDPTEKTGQKMPAGSPWYALVEKNGGQYLSPGFFDDQARLVSVRLVPGYPLVVNVALTEFAALSVWRKRASVIAAGTLLAIICAGVLLFAVSRQFNQLKLSRAELARRSNELRTALAHLGAAVNNLAQGISMFDGDHKLVVYNKPYLEIYGLSPDLVAPGTTFKEILLQRKAAGNYTSDPDSFVIEMAKQVQGGKNFRHLTSLSNDRIISVTAHPMEDGGWVALHEDITERYRADQVVSHMAYHDALTGLANRIEFGQKLNEAFDQFEKDKKPFALLLIDLDHFKSINDSLGHLAGDALLKDTAARLLSCVRAPSTVARLGGDEFAVLLSMVENAETGARLLANRILNAFGQPFEIFSHQVRIGISVGISLASINGQTAVELMNSADLALYAAKAQGRNIFRFHCSLKSEGEKEPTPRLKIA